MSVESNFALALALFNCALWLVGKVRPLFSANGKPKPIVICLHAFSRAWRVLHVFASDSDWFIVLFTSFVINQNDYFRFGFKGRFSGPVQISCDFCQFTCRGRISFDTSKMRRLSWAFLVTWLFTFLFQAQKRPFSNVNRRLFWKWRKQEDNWTGSELCAPWELHRGKVDSLHRFCIPHAHGVPAKMFLQTQCKIMLTRRVFYNDFDVTMGSFLWESRIRIFESNPLWVRIRRFLWYTMIRVILDQNPDFPKETHPTLR